MDGNNIVHIAVINKEMTALKLITEMLEKLKVEDILDYQNKKSSTALHLAVESGQLDATRMLLQSKASPDVYDKDGDAPVHISVRNQNSEKAESEERNKRAEGGGEGVAPSLELEVAVGDSDMRGSIENLNPNEVRAFLEDDLQEAIDMY